MDWVCIVCQTFVGLRFFTEITNNSYTATCVLRQAQMLYCKCFSISALATQHWWKVVIATQPQKPQQSIKQRTLVAKVAKKVTHGKIIFTKRLTLTLVQIQKKQAVFSWPIMLLIRITKSIKYVANMIIHSQWMILKFYSLITYIVVHLLYEMNI